MKVKDIMTKSVISLNDDDTVEKAAQIMQQNNVGAVPVCKNGKVIGIVTDRDIAIRSASQSGGTESKFVRDIMSANPVTGSPDMNLEDASRIMSDKQIRRLPIVENKNVVGMVSLGDLAVNPKSNTQAGDALSSISENNYSAF
ncbi:CBS domain-containing protein [Clostridium ljungdahlii]|nr:CBS domain-containing protein [Clostridium ljungdahlii]